MKSEWIDIREYVGEGYAPVIDYDKWRVAILRYCEELLVPNITHMQKHSETDEVFVLLEGQCILFAGGEEENISSVEAVNMQPLKLYNVRKGVWHTHTLSTNASVLIIENRDTGDHNSPTTLLNNEQKAKMEELLESLWKAY